MSWETLAGIVRTLLLLCLAVPVVCMAQVPPMPEEPTEHRGHALQDLAEARAAFEEDRNDEARLEYAKLLYETGYFELAEDAVTPLLGAAEPPVDGVMLAARVAYLSGRYEEAEHLFGAALARDPENRRALAGLIFTYYQTNRYARCLELPEEVREKIQIPHMDMMLAFEGEEPYRAAWRGGPRTEVPFLVADPLPVVEVEIDGHKVTALIDTGGDAFILDPEIADSLGIEIVASMMGMFGGGMEAEVGFAKADSLTLGGVTLHSVPLSVLPTRGFVLGGHKIGGILGTGVLKQFLSTLDYPNDRLILRERSGEASGAFDTEVRGSVEDEVPFYLHSTHFLMAKGSLNGYDGLVFHIDSGLAGEAAFSATELTLEYVGIPTPEVAVHENVVGGGGGGFAIGSFPVETLGLGNLVQTDLIGSFGAQPPASYRMLGFIQDGLVSHNFLRQYAWTIDFERMRMVFTK